MKLSRSLALAVLAFGALLATTAHQVAASPPEIQVVNVDDTYVAPGLTRDCGFVVMRNDLGTIRIATFYRDGQPVREVDHYNINHCFTAHGHTIQARDHGLDSTEFHSDGSATLRTIGLAMFVLPGYGPVEGFAGNFVVEVDPYGNETVVHEAGQNHPLSPETHAILCGALAP